ncbi:MAG: carboxypeptidase-like regulatory domain-containing protein [Bacteroidetes bacterium]|nr:carboxypeptidase-like regulatory domain-containing protein [Bacteroidota bacterium]
MMQRLFLSVIFMVGALGLWAQDYVGGVVVDAANGSPIPFANVVLKGSYKGTATNFEGEFTLVVSKAHIHDTLLITVVGYKNLELPVSDYLDQAFHRFELQPFVYEIGDVTVETKSQYYNTIVKKAAEQVTSNYLPHPYNYDMYYRNTQTEGEKLAKERQAAVRLYDAKGYAMAQAIEAYTDRGYEFIQVRRNFELGSLRDRSTLIDDLLEFDLVRMDNSVMNPLNVYSDFDMELERMTEVDGDSVWVIGFNCLAPRLGNCGDVYATGYKGTVFIKKKDHAVVRYEATYTCSNYSAQGRSLYVNEDKQKASPVEIVYSVSTRYKKQGNSYHLSSVNYERNHVWKDKATGAQREERMLAQLLVTDVVTENPQVISKRAYYEEIPYDEKFWKNFNYLKDEN